VIGVGRGDRDGRGDKARNQQEGREREPRVTMPRAIHDPIVRPRLSGGNASVVPAAGPRGPVPAGNAGISEPSGGCDHL